MNAFADCLDEIRNVSEPVTRFVAYDRGYYAILRNGARIDVIRAFAFQPDIKDFDDYRSYLLLQALQGFFLLRQSVRENRVSPWTVVCEIVPKDTAGFFSALHDLRESLCEFAESQDIALDT
ncbi:MAG: hypothetical protein AB1742_10300 [bacterium]